MIYKKSVLGIDEAGRGPIIGPMVIAGFFLKDKSLISYFKKIKIKSSKLLSPEKRKKFYTLFLKLKKSGAADFSVKSISPKVIDNYSLNELFKQSVLYFIKKYKPQKIYIDACVNPKGLKKYRTDLLSKIETLYRNESKNTPKNFLRSRFLICQNFADENYPIVAAASIIAKITRDNHIKKLHRKYFCDFGSGYCHDKKTIEFLKNYYKQKGGFPIETRLKWKSFLNFLK